MLSDIDKLVKYQDQEKELNDLKKKLPDEEAYEEVNVEISPQTLIKVTWTNKDGNYSKSRQFPFSAIQDISERARKKIDYRKNKPEK